MPNSKCQSLRKDGQACGADAQTGKSVCIFHDPERSADAVRARRAGGIARSQPPSVLSSNTPETRLISFKEVSSLLGDSINQVLRGEIDPRIANTVGYLSAIPLKALEQGEVEERLSKLEAAVTREKTPDKDINEGEPDKAN
jgi:hypothetical protein